VIGVFLFAVIPPLLEGPGRTPDPRVQCFPRGFQRFFIDPCPTSAVFLIVMLFFDSLHRTLQFSPLPDFLLDPISALSPNRPSAIMSPALCSTFCFEIGTPPPHYRLLFFPRTLCFLIFFQQFLAQRSPFKGSIVGFSLISSFFTADFSSCPFRSLPQYDLPFRCLFLFLKFPASGPCFFVPLSFPSLFRFRMPCCWSC